MEEKKRILGPIEWLAILIGLALLTYITLDQGGCKIVEKTEDVEFIDPHDSNQLAPPPRKSE